MNRLFYGLMILLVFGCSRKIIDKKPPGTSYPFKYEELTIFENFILFEYRDSTQINRDGQVISPKHFRIKLPRNIMFYQITDLANFGFFYKDDQVIYINMKLEGVLPASQKTFVPSKDSLNRYLSDVSLTPYKNFDISNIQTSNRRLNAFYDRGDVIILLYNIKDNNFRVFSDFVEKFEYLDY